MRTRRLITVVGCHAGGEIGNVVVGGVLPPAGATVFEQMQTLEREGDGLRKLLLREPRGSVACHANLVVPATRADCDAGFIIMEPTEYPAMSGSNTICTTTVLLETGMLAMTRAGDGRPAGGAGRRRRGAGGLPRRPLRERRVHERPLLRRPARRAAGGGGTRARSRSTSPTAACGTRSRTRARSGSRSSRTRRATSRSPASGSVPPRASSCRAPIRRTRRSPASASSSSRSRGRASAR